jgi:propionyl-CoA synthetase
LIVALQKILRNLLRKIVDGDPFDIPPTIDDREVPRAITMRISRK